MSESQSESAGGMRRGSIMRLFGVVLIFLGTLDAMLSWRGGLALSDFYILLFALGLVFYAVGSVRRESGG
ncbi:MAG: hypothetical protein ACE5FM_09260 [Methyloligellaceae bacterium]